MNHQTESQSCHCTSQWQELFLPHFPRELQDLCPPLHPGLSAPVLTVATPSPGLLESHCLLLGSLNVFSGEILVKYYQAQMQHHTTLVRGSELCQRYTQTRFPAERLFGRQWTKKYWPFCTSFILLHFQAATSPFLWQGMKLHQNLYNEKQSRGK